MYCRVFAIQLVSAADESQITPAIESAARLPDNRGQRLGSGYIETAAEAGYQAVWWAIYVDTKCVKWSLSQFQMNNGCCEIHPGDRYTCATVCRGAGSVLYNNLARILHRGGNVDWSGLSCPQEGESDESPKLESPDSAIGESRERPPLASRESEPPMHAYRGRLL